MGGGRGWRRKALEKSVSGPPPASEVSQSIISSLQGRHRVLGEGGLLVLEYIKQPLMSQSSPHGRRQAMLLCVLEATQDWAPGSHPCWAGSHSGRCPTRRCGVPRPCDCPPTPAFSLLPVYLYLPSFFPPPFSSLFKASCSHFRSSALSGILKAHFSHHKQANRCRE